jgi:transcriptional regulator with XRE-family HTH domain
MKRHTLRTVRKARRLSVTELARRANLHKSIVSRIDRGERQPSIDTAEALELALGLVRGALKFPKPRKGTQGVAA